MARRRITREFRHPKNDDAIVHFCVDMCRLDHLQSKEYD